MKTRITWVIITILTMNHPLLPQTPLDETGADSIKSNYLTGDWGGFRQSMVDHGITLELTYTGENFYNASGGIKQGYTYLGNLDTTLDINFMDLISWKGAELFIYGLGGHGGSPTEFAGDMQASSNIETGMDYYKLYEIWFQQSLLDDKISFLMGLHDLNSEFYVNDPAGLFFNSSLGIGADLSQTGVNGPSIFPSAALAARLKVQPIEGLYLMGGAYNAIAGNPDFPEKTYADFKFKSGILGISEAGYYKEGETKIAFGGWGYSVKEPSVKNGKSTQPYGAYLLADKTIAQNYSFFFRGGIANKELYSIEYNLSTGIVISGAIFSRENDQFGLASTSIIAPAYLSQIGMDTHETSIELTYRLQITPWLAFQPDIQYIINPGMNSATSDALATSIRGELLF